MIRIGKKPAQENETINPRLHMEYFCLINKKTLK